MFLIYENKSYFLLPRRFDLRADGTLVPRGGDGSLVLGTGYSQVLFNHLANLSAFRMGLFIVLKVRSEYSNSAYLH